MLLRQTLRAARALDVLRDHAIDECALLRRERLRRVEVERAEVGLRRRGEGGRLDGPRGGGDVRGGLTGRIGKPIRRPALLGQLLLTKNRVVVKLLLEQTPWERGRPARQFLAKSCLTAGGTPALPGGFRHRTARSVLIDVARQIVDRAQLLEELAD